MNMNRSMKVLAAVAALGLPLPSLAESGLPPVMLYKNPQCGCCEGHAEHLRDYGFTVDVKPTHELSAMSRSVGISEDMQGCHLAFVDGYVVSGHVPAGTIKRLLTERPRIMGISLPGMPPGSPGMNGEKLAPFEIFEIGSGARKIYAVE